MLITDDPQEDKFTNDEIHDTPLEDILEGDKGDDWDEEDKPADKPDDKPDDPKEAKADDTPDDKGTKTDVPEEKTPDAPAPALDPEKLKEEVSQATAEKLIKALTGGDEDKSKEEKDELKKLMETAPWVLEKRSPTYDEVIAWTVKTSTPIIKDQVKAELAKEAEDEEKREADEAAAAVKEQEDVNKRWTDHWAGQMTDLETSGKIPPINAQDTRVDAQGFPLDPGKKVRLKLFARMKEVSAERVAKNLPPITNLKEIYYEHYKSDEPAGADAPVNGARQTASQDKSEIGFGYPEIHNAEFSDLLK